MSYYHGGVPGLALGGSILPPSQTGRRDSARMIVAEYGLDGAHVRDDVVFLATNRDIADLFAAMYPGRAGGWVYEVEPVGSVEPDPDYHGPADESVQCASAVIVRVHGALAPAYVAMVRRVMMGGAA